MFNLCDTPAQLLLNWSARHIFGLLILLLIPVDSPSAERSQTAELMSPHTSVERTFRVRMRDQFFERLYQRAAELGISPELLASQILERAARRLGKPAERRTSAA